jgi:glycosyltransferase involved in cell wall biosynthesis
MIFLMIAIGLALVYMAIQFQYLYYWKKIKSVSVPHDYSPSTGVSVIVVARNEVDSIEACIRGLISQSYPSHLFEIIIVNDHSADGTANKILAIPDQRIQLLHLSDFPEYIHAPAYKKSAVTLGVEKARFDLVVVTDADCLHATDWIRSVTYSLEKIGAVFQTAPVLLLPGQSLLEQMQEVEMLMYMLITGSGIQSGLQDMANGANMAFPKAAFQTVHGYEGNYQYASGDDMFLIEKMRTAFPDKICFAKSIEATVLTKGKSNWSDLIKQRLRWASKNKGLKNKSISLIWFFVGLLHFSLLLFLVLAIFQIIGWWPFLIVLNGKWVADYFLLQQAAGFFNRTSVLRKFIPLQFLYFWYILRLGIYMAFGNKMDWKR